MVTPELVNYIKSQLSQGKSQEEVKKTLISQGWKEVDINLAFSQSVVGHPIASQIPENTSDITEEAREMPRSIFDFKHMKWYEWVAMLPAFFLLVQGGAVGAGIGVLGWSWVLKVIRNEDYSKVVKILLVIGITIAYYVLAILAASFILGLIEGVSEGLSGQ